MQIKARVGINNGSYDDWKLFYDSYKVVRDKYIADEKVLRVSDNEASVMFKIRDLSGLTSLSKSQFVLDGEARLGIEVTLVQ
jgi:hypothetical protein